jgi:hypothetical protein
LEINKKNNVDMDIDDYEHNIPDEPQPQPLENDDVDMLELNNPPVHISKNTASPQQDILDFDILDVGPSDKNAQSMEPTLPEKEPEKIKKIECLSRELDQDDFQEWWVDIEEELEGSIKPCGNKTLTHDLADFLEENNIMCMASKDNDDGNQQFYMYAYLGVDGEDPDEMRKEAWVLSEINLWSSTKEVEYLLKGFDESVIKQFESILVEILKQ